MRCIFLGVAAAMMAAVPVLADEPVYLQCEAVSSSGQSRVHYAITLNEGQGTAGAVLLETGLSVQNVPAAFSQAEVSFSSRGSTTQVFTVGRVDLSFKDEIRFGGSSIVRTGKCALAPKVTRKF